MKLLSSLLLFSLFGAATAQEPSQGLEPVITVNGQDFYTWQDYTSSAAFRYYNLRCATPGASATLANLPAYRSQASSCTLNKTVIKTQYDPDQGILYQIPVVFHVIYNSNNKGNLGNKFITSQIDILNEDFEALLGTPGENGTNVRVHFYLATEDPNGNPTNGIDRVQNDNWFNDNGNYKSALAWDTNRYLNIYTNTASGALGYAYLPNGTGVVGTSTDGVVLLYSAVGRNAKIGPPYNQGRTATHEVGHYLGLLHTFDGGCGTSLCNNTGDLICDTNAEKNARFGCPTNASSCGNLDPVRNYMDYTDDTCMTHFTAEQANRIRCTMATYRPNLHTPMCPTAAASTSRNGGTNPAVFSSNKPVLGEDLTYSIFTNPYTFATIIGYAGAGSLTLAGGQTVLVDLASPKIFQLGPLAGPNASITVGIPLDLSFCGTAYSAQAILFGGTTPYALTNALDQVVGGF
ncbi:MAG TPA: zinc metalloprotease [Planctomycetes bacterium]|nr:zinc metalloprotease [Planctomycetota bacterium]